MHAGAYVLATSLMHESEVQWYFCLVNPVNTFSEKQTLHLQKSRKHDMNRNNGIV